MSPWLMPSLRLGLAHDHVCVVRLARGLRPRITGQSAESFEPSRASPPWPRAIERASALVRQICRKGDRLTVVLSNRLVRYVVVPWVPEVTRSEERLALAQHAFRSVYADPTSERQIMLASGGYGRPSLAAAIERDLVDALTALATEAQTRLVAIEPLLLCAIREAGRSLGKERDRVVLAVREPGYLTCLHLREGDVESVSARRVRSSEESVDLIRSDIVSLGLGTEHRTAILVCPENPGADHATYTDAIRVAQPHSSRALTAGAGAELGLALCGARP